VVDFYNLDMIISVGYRIKSRVATRFRQWATQRLREYIVKGFVLDDERLKNPDQPFDYFDELLRRIQDIRTSERRFYQKITDIYATSVEIIYDRVDAGRISHDVAKELAGMEYEKFNRRRIRYTDSKDSDFDKIVKQIENHRYQNGGTIQ